MAKGEMLVLCFYRYRAVAAGDAPEYFNTVMISARRLSMVYELFLARMRKDLARWNWCWVGLRPHPNTVELLGYMAENGLVHRYPEGNATVH